jgi:hypothetical protein
MKFIKNYIRRKLIDFLEIEDVVSKQVIRTFNDNNDRLKHIVGQAVSDACSGQRVESWGWGNNRPNLQDIVADTTKRVAENAVEHTIKQATLNHIQGEKFLDDVITRIKVKQLN